MMGELPKMLTLRQAADATGLSYCYLRRLCIDGEIYAIRAGVKWLISSPSLAAYLGGSGVK